MSVVCQQLLILLMTVTKLGLWGSGIHAMQTVRQECYMCFSDVNCKAGVLCLYLRCVWENQEVFRIQTLKITALSVKVRGMEFTGIDCALSWEQIRMIETC
jgi:hypothetical protein